MTARASDPGMVYLLHLDRPYGPGGGANGRGTARHYIWTRDLADRLAEHAQGRGARLLEVVRDAGIGWRLARTWEGGRDRERQLKNQGGASRCCPECGVKPRPSGNHVQPPLRHGQSIPHCQTPCHAHPRTSVAR